MKTLDRLSNIFWLLIGLYVSVHAYILGLGKLHEPGPGFIFFLAGVFLSMLSAVGLFVTFFTKAREERTLKNLWSGLRWPKIIIVLGGLCAWIYFFSFFGFFLSTFLLLIFLFRAVEPIKWWMAVLAAFIIVLISYAVFDLWLHVPFPKGFIRV